MYGPPPATAPRRRGATFAGRPRFVAVLTAAALGAAAYDAVRLLTGGSQPGLGAHWLGWTVTGTTAAGVMALRMGVHLVGAYGLWQLRAWGRMGGMLYLAAILASMLFVWRPSGYGAASAGTALLWQISMIPLATFCLMYLYRGERDFEQRQPRQRDAS